MPSGPCAQLDKLRRRRGSTWGHGPHTDEGKRGSKRAGQDFAHACCVAGLGPARGSAFQGGAPDTEYREGELIEWPIADPGHCCAAQPLPKPDRTCAMTADLFRIFTPSMLFPSLIADLCFHAKATVGGPSFPGDG